MTAAPTNPYLTVFDTETWRITPGLLAPPLVVGAFLYGGEGKAAFLMPPESTLDEVERLLDDPDAILVGQNVAYDFGVCVHARPRLLPKVFAAYDAGRVRDIRIRDKLLLLARGEMKTEGKPTKFSLEDIVRRRFDVDLSEEKGDEDAWRLRYSELDGIPIAEWPEAAREYPKHDVEWTLKVYLDQEREAGPLARSTANLADLDTGVFLDEARQTRAAWALHLMAMWGVRTDATAVAALEKAVEEHVDGVDVRLHKLGFLKPKRQKNEETGLHEVVMAKDTKFLQAKVAAYFESKGVAVPKTAPSSKFPQGQVKTDEDTLEMCDDPELSLLVERGAYQKVKSVWLRFLQQGTSGPVCPGWNEMVENGRTSAQKPPVQQPHRKGGLRSCFVPRKGFWYLSADYSTLELCAWSQVCLDTLGFSDMADAIRNDVDLHVDMGAEILQAEGKDVDYETLNAARKAGEAWAKDARQLAKAANFGLPGGLGPDTFIVYARSQYGVILDRPRAVTIKQAWLRKWKQAQPYFDLISSGSPYGGEFRVRQLRSHRVRGGCTFTTGANTFFSGLASDGAKEAMWRIAKACYSEESSPLYGCRPVLFLHDEFILEVPADPDRAHAAHLELLRHMVEGMQVFIPDVPIKAEPTLMARWYKEGEPVYDAHGRLTLWEPKPKKSEEAT
jgi:DNA polymerase-1